MRMRGKKPIFNYKDCWSMDLTLSPIICEGLKKFREELVKHPCAGYPSDFHKGDVEKDSEASYQEWLDTLSKMIYAFDVKNEPSITDYNFTFETEWKTLGNGNSELISIDPTDVDEYNRYKKDCVEYQKKCDEGRKLFSEFYHSLWI